VLGGIGVLDDFWGGTENWPPLMGNPLVVLESGLRGFWGKFWHQLFRNVRILLKFDICTDDLVIDGPRQSTCHCVQSPSQVSASVCNPGDASFHPFWSDPCSDPSSQHAKR
jgi:Membrane bound O-acyl transferase family